MSTQYSSSDLDHLGIVAGICRKLGLAELINQLVGPTRRRVTVGDATVALILNGLGFVSRALYLTPEFYRTKPVERLLGVEGITADDLHDVTHQPRGASAICPQRRSWSRLPQHRRSHAWTQDPR